MRLESEEVRQYIRTNSKPRIIKSALSYLDQIVPLVPWVSQGKQKMQYKVPAKRSEMIHTVSILWDDEGIISKCTCSTKIDSLCFHEVVALTGLMKRLQAQETEQAQETQHGQETEQAQETETTLNKALKPKPPVTILKKLVFQKRRVYLRNLDDFILFIPAIVYDRKEVDLFSNEKVIERTPESRVLYERDKEEEESFHQFFMKLHPRFKGQESRGYFYLSLKDFLNGDWFLEVFDSIREAGIEVMGLKDLDKMPYNPNRGSFSLSVSSGQDWLDLKITVQFGDQVASLKDVRKAVLNQDRFVVLEDGSRGVLPEAWIKRLRLFFSLGAVKRNKLKLASFHFSLFEELTRIEMEKKLQEELEEKKKKLLEFEHIQSYPIPNTISATLRQYQVAGYNWLNFLDEYGWGGCLADDMGLGKTLQTLAFLNRQVALHPNTPNLIVVPTTLIFNWQEEINKFSPQLNCLVHSGTNRTKDPEKLKGYDVILVSYGLILRDIKWLKDVEFNYVVLDESQAIKNPLSQRYKAALLLKARNRLALTGTPIENNTYDLFAQFNFLNPGLLGNRTFFRKTFSDPIDKFGDPEAANYLRKLIAPFLLRRTKEKVATELPEKTESILYCEMEPEQRNVYDAFKKDLRDKIEEQIASQGMKKSGIYIIDALLKLRQICNSPRILNTEADYGSDSIKLKELMRNVQEKTGNHKILVFSQFVKMLGLIREELADAGIPYAYLDGSTRNRQEIVENFQNDPKVRVFLISLKAGGVGLNLTSADYVFLVDPWWNPAVEAQAIDRTHRIGQTKKVFAYKMICKDSVEEKVLLLQAKKKGIADDLIKAEEKFFKSLTQNEVMDLFA